MQRQFTYLLHVLDRASYLPSVSFIRGHILIGTPGRLEDLFARKKDGLDLAAHVRSLVST